MPIKTLRDSKGRTLRFGRKRPVSTGPRFRLRNYLMASMAAPPETCDYRAPAVSALSRVYLNDTLANCVIAMVGHEAGIFTSGAGSPFIFSDAQLISLYSAIGGYVPGDPSTDNGCDEVTALNYWQNNGAPAGSHKIAGWLSVDPANKAEYRTALWLFENLAFGVELPDAWISPFPSAPGFTWDVAGTPDPSNGHAFCASAYGDGCVLIDTWGMAGRLTDAAIQYYCAASQGGALYTVLSADAINKARQKAPNGIDWSQLVADFDSMGGSVTA